MARSAKAALGRARGAAIALATAGLLLPSASSAQVKEKKRLEDWLAQPGTKEFRAALRDALEGVKNAAGAHGIFNMSAKDHLGLDQRAAVMIQIRDGKWVMQK